MKEVMLDLETMGKGSDAAIVAIGAVRFDLNQLTVDPNAFHCTIDLESSSRFGSIDASTILWWLQQQDAARHEITKGGYSLEVALRIFSVWLGFGSRVWGNGAAFDNVVLRNAYQSLSQQAPWSYKDDRCYRTVRALYPDIKADPFDGAEHVAVNDAFYQAHHIVKIFKMLNTKGDPAPCFWQIVRNFQAKSIQWIFR